MPSYHYTATRSYYEVITAKKDILDTVGELLRKRDTLEVLTLL